LVFLLVVDAIPVGIWNNNTGAGRTMAPSGTEIKKAKPSDKLQKLSDGGGLQLHIVPTGGKLWRLTLRFPRGVRSCSVLNSIGIAIAPDRQVMLVCK
jgi:hypothetical protein